MRVFCLRKKDFNLAQHPLIEGVLNLQVIKLMQSFKSKEYVRETFAWMHYYWFLTNEGIDFLRTYLNLPSEIVPATLKKQHKPLARPMGDRPRGPPRSEGERRFGDRDGYRGGPRSDGEFGDKNGAPSDYYQPSFRDFGDSTDKMDCQMVMAILAYIYIQSFIVHQDYSVEMILD